MFEPRHLTEDSATCLRRILDPDVDVAIWRRRGQPPMHKIFREPLPKDFPNVRFATSADTLEQDLVKHDALQRTLWLPIAEDLEALVRIYAAIAGIDRVRLRLEHPKDDGCRLFHVDSVRLRLVVTYHGPGTEWLAEHDLNRSGLERGDNALVIRGENVIRRVPRYAVAMFKGEKFTGVPKSGAVHRSPPIAVEGLERSLVVIDDAVENE